MNLIILNLNQINNETWDKLKTGICVCVCVCVLRTLVKSAFTYRKIISYISTKTYVVDTQKNRLNETVLLSTQNICQKYGEENINNFALKSFVYQNLCIFIKL